MAAAEQAEAKDHTSLPAEADGPHVMDAEFFTTQCIVRATFSSSEMRAADYLNSLLPALEIRPTSIHSHATGQTLDLPSSCGRIPKAQLLFVLPLVEPVPLIRPGSPVWRQKHPRRGWIGIGPYVLQGTLHTEAGDDPELALRRLDREFVAITDVHITLPGGAEREANVVLLNHQHVDLLALGDTPSYLQQAQHAAGQSLPT
jgi:hypothetical protein